MEQLKFDESYGKDKDMFKKQKTTDIPKEQIDKEQINQMIKEFYSSQKEQEKFVKRKIKDELDPKLDMLNDRLNQFDDRLDRFDQNLNQLDDSLKQVDSRLKRLETSEEARKTEYNDHGINAYLNKKPIIGIVLSILSLIGGPVLAYFVALMNVPKDLQEIKSLIKQEVSVAIEQNVDKTAIDDEKTLDASNVKEKEYKKVKSGEFKSAIRLKENVIEQLSFNVLSSAEVLDNPSPYKAGRRSGKIGKNPYILQDKIDMYVKDIHYAFTDAWFTFN